MAGVKRQINYSEVKPSVTTVKNKDGTSYEYRSDDKTGIFLLAERIKDSNEYLEDKSQKVTCKPSVQEGKPGLDIVLPSGVSFRVEDKHIMVSDFGLTSAQIKELRQFFYMHGIEDFSLPNTDDCEFEEKLQQAEEELNKDPLGFATGERQDLPPEPSANDNEPSPTEGMSDDEIRAYKRGLAEQAKNATNLEENNKSLNYGGGKKLVYPSQEAILQAFNNHVSGTKKDLSNNYKINSIGNGYELIFYTDSEQKNDGAEEDKKGHKKPNYQFALRGEIFRDSKGSPQLSITFMTPKYGKMEDWMFDEVMNLADANKITHMKFEAGLQHKAGFFNACAKKLMIPTGVKLKQKDVDAMIKIAKENNDKTEERKNYYLRLAAQLEENMQNENTYSDETHSFHETIKKLRDWANTEGPSAVAKAKYDKFNDFYEKNIMGQVFKDKEDEENPVNDAVKELASGKAYLDVLNEFGKNKDFEGASGEDKMKFFNEKYNEYVFEYDKTLSKNLEGLKYNDRTQLIKGECNQINQEIEKGVLNLKNGLSVEIKYPKVVQQLYLGDGKDTPNPNANSIELGRRIVEARERGAQNEHQNPIPVGRGGGRQM